MAEEKALVSMAQQFTGLPMDDLIGAPLNAAANANAAMAITQTRFILDTCFYTEGQDTDVEYKPIMITMTLVRGVLTPGAAPGDAPTIDQIETKFDLPMITIIPINSLGVDDVAVTFEMEVKSSYGEEQSEETEKQIQASAEWEVKVGWGPVSSTIKGSASYDQKDSSSFNTHYEKSNSAKYTVNVHAGQLPVPKGVNTIIEAFTQAITPIELPAAAAA